MSATPFAKDSPASHKTVIVLGMMRRTGTNFLTELLLLHPACGQPAPIWEDFLVHDFDLLRKYCDTTGRRWEQVFSLGAVHTQRLYRHVGAGILSFLAAHTDPSKECIVTKTPSVRNIWNLSLFFPESHVLVIVRDGRAVVESGVNSFGWSYESAMKRWAMAAQNVLNHLWTTAGHDQRVKIVRYEDLYCDRIRTMREVFEFLELEAGSYDFDAAMRIPVRGSSQVRSSTGTLHWRPVLDPQGFDPLTRWKEWGRETHEKFERIAGRYQRALGYPVGQAEVVRSQRPTDDIRPATSNEPPHLNVVIPTHRRPAALNRLLAALRPQVEGRTDRRVIVVNDGTHDEAYGAVVDQYRDIIDYVTLPANRGQSAARNAGAARATDGFLVFTDDDCEPPSYWLDWLEARLAANPDLDVVVGTTELLPTAPARLLERFLARFNRHPKPILRGGDIVFFVTANCAVRRDWFVRVGGFDERFRSAEDRDLTYRLRRLGATFYVDPSWVTRHDPSASLRAHLRRHFVYGYWSPVQIARERRPSVGRKIPASLPGWLPHVIGWGRRYFQQLHGSGLDPATRLAFVFLGILTELAFDLGYWRGRKAVADPDKRMRIISGQQALGP